MQRAAGFTLVELITVVVILAILAAVVMPRMDTGYFRALSFHDQVVGTLRFAQKTATSHRRQVCVAFTASSVALTMAKANGSALCDTPLVLPGQSSNTVQSGSPTQVVFSPVPADFAFHADGSGADRSLAIAGQAVIVVVGATGHVQ